MVIGCIFVHALAYNFSIGQLLMYYAAKMLESTGPVMVINWFLVFMVALSTEMLMRNLGVGKLCLLFCILLAFCTMFLIPGVPSDQPSSESSLNEPLALYARKSAEFEMSTEAASEKSDPNNGPTINGQIGVAL